MAGLCLLIAALSSCPLPPDIMLPLLLTCHFLPCSCAPVQQELYPTIPEDTPLYDLRKVVPEAYKPR